MENNVSSARNLFLYLLVDITAVTLIPPSIEKNVMKFNPYIKFSVNENYFIAKTIGLGMVRIFVQMNAAVYCSSSQDFMSCV